MHSFKGSIFFAIEESIAIPEEEPRNGSIVYRHPTGSPAAHWICILRSALHCTRQPHSDPGTHNLLLNERGNTASKGILPSVRRRK